MLQLGGPIDDAENKVVKESLLKFLEDEDWFEAICPTPIKEFKNNYIKCLNKSKNDFAVFECIFPSRAIPALKAAIKKNIDLITESIFINVKLGIACICETCDQPIGACYFGNDNILLCNDFSFSIYLSENSKDARCYGLELSNIHLNYIDEQIIEEASQVTSESHVRDRLFAVYVYDSLFREGYDLGRLRQLENALWMMTEKETVDNWHLFYEIYCRLYMVCIENISVEKGEMFFARAVNTLTQALRTQSKNDDLSDVSYRKYVKDLLQLQNDGQTQKMKNIFCNSLTGLCDGLSVYAANQLFDAVIESGKQGSVLYRYLFEKR